MSNALTYITEFNVNFQGNLCQFPNTLSLILPYFTSSLTFATMFVALVEYEALSMSGEILHLIFNNYQSI
jgi:hypothetical protein